MDWDIENSVLSELSGNEDFPKCSFCAFRLWVIVGITLVLYSTAEMKKILENRVEQPQKN